jgi:cysteine desulfurase
VRSIYADYAATTPLYPGVLEAMLPWLGECFGNPSSIHQWGREARSVIDASRDRVASALGCLSGEIFFTSSATEAANLGIVGLGLQCRFGSRKRLLFSCTEHHCVLETRTLLESLGYVVELIPVDRYGAIDEALFEDLLDDDVLLVSVMYGNNETGFMEDVNRIGELCKRVGAVYFCDAVQSFTQYPIDLKLKHETVDMMAIASHKIYGPKGVGALYVRSGVKIAPLLRGGGQERELRAGTEDVAGIVGFAKAVSLALEDRGRLGRVTQVRNRFRESVNRLLGERVRWTLEGVSDEKILGGHAHLRVLGSSAESVLIGLDRMGVGASSGSACSSGSLEPSHVLMAMGYSKAEASEGLRFSFGALSSESDGEVCAERLASVVEMRY